MFLRTLLTSPCRASLSRINHFLPPSAAQFSHFAPRWGEVKHYDLPTFIAHAELNGLDPGSTVYRGTIYEYVVKRTLYYKNMILSRTGGRDDGGIDLRGEWHIPIPPRPDPNSVLQSDTEPKPHRHHEHYCDHNDDYEPSEEPPSGYPRTKPIRVIIQCKGLTTVPAGPNLIRELAGAISSSMGGTIGILATMTPCTTGCRNAIRYSSKPMGYVCISEDGVIKQFVWNHRAELIVGTGLRVGVRNTEEVKGDPMGQEVVLTLDGEIVDGLLLSPVEVEIKLSKKQRKMQEQAAKKQLVKKTKEQYKEEGRRKKEAWNRRKQEMERYTD